MFSFLALVALLFTACMTANQQKEKPVKLGLVGARAVSINAGPDEALETAILNIYDIWDAGAYVNNAVATIVGGGHTSNTALNTYMHDAIHALADGYDLGLTYKAMPGGADPRCMAYCDSIYGACTHGNPYPGPSGVDIANHLRCLLNKMACVKSCEKGAIGWVGAVTW